MWPAIPKRLHSALKALCSLAEAGEPMQSREVAQQIGVSPAETAKVLQLLVWGGFVRSRRGSSGGFWLTQLPNRIRAGRVISFFASHHQLSIEGDDVVSRAIRKTGAQCRKRFERLTVADLAAGRLESRPQKSARKVGLK